ncbi:DUF397 domain-containing protein [Streptomyces sp. LBUM 1476]|nr:DUF397 domain-containing protein [Streptomyces sp. LBUM 1476]
MAQVNLQRQQRRFLPLEVLDGHPTSVPVRAPTLLIPASAWTPFIAAVRTSPLHP